MGCLDRPLCTALIDLMLCPEIESSSISGAIVNMVGWLWAGLNRS
jgi:hypothetical protein